MIRFIQQSTRPALLLGRVAALTIAALAAPADAPAQGLFTPVLQVNGRVITQYDLQQRALFFTLLSAPGDPEESARERLIEEKLQLQAAAQLGLSLTPEQIAAGETEFAGRVNMDRETFIQALAAGGVEEQTFRDFVTAGLLWREVVRQQFRSRVVVSDADIDNELRATRPNTGALRLLYSEIILPADTPANKETALRRAREIKEYTSVDAFSQAARAFSAAPSAGAGGRVDWANASEMQPGLVQILLSLGPGQVSDPIPIQNGIALLQLRAVEDGPPPEPEGVEVDYAVWLIPGGRSPAALAEAASVEAAAVSCNDLYELNRRRKGPDDRLERVTGPMSEVPVDIALELGHMDPGEFSTGITRGGFLALVMLCSRQAPLPEGVTRDQIRNQLADRQMQALADSWLAEMRDSAVYRVP